MTANGSKAQKHHRWLPMAALGGSPKTATPFAMAAATDNTAYKKRYQKIIEARKGLYKNAYTSPTYPVEYDAKTVRHSPNLRKTSNSSCCFFIYGFAIWRLPKWLKCDREKWKWKLSFLFYIECSQDIKVQNLEDWKLQHRDWYILCY